MNVRRVVILGVAAVAAIAATLLARNMLGGGTPNVAAGPLEATDVMVAAVDLEPGQALDASNIRWQPWPKNSLSPTLVTRDLHPDGVNQLSGAVARAPMVAGEPVTENKIAHIGQAGFMSAMIAAGKRAISIPISAKTGAGGFVLPNDRVDVILTRQVGGNRNFQVETVLRDIRVLAIDQVFKEDKGKQSAVGDTATLELSPEQAETLALAQAQGTLSLALRGLAENANQKLEEENESWGRRGSIAVIRYGVARSSTTVAGGPQ